ncbi:MAG: hypothetical protein O2955_05030, partial [Planctomycetota bacterium]|nr:hypothetical protein [Planctomycetota bacterium]
MNRIAATICFALLVCGCGSDTPPDAAHNATSTVPKSTNDSSSPANVSSPEDKAKAAPAKNSHATTVDDQLKKITKEVQQKNWDAADTKLSALRETLGDDATEDQLASLIEIENAVAAGREEIRREQRQSMLMEAKSAYDNGEWDTSFKKIDAIAALAPTEAERISLNELRNS